MAIVQSPDSEYARETSKWDLPKRQGGFNANGFEAFPVMLYKAHARANGKVMCGDPLATVGDAEAEAFSRSCQLHVRGPEDLARAYREGWADSPEAALAAYERAQIDIADTAAKRHFSDQTMSAQAQAEAVVADAATHEHVAAVPVRKKRSHHKKKKVTTDGPK
jgi:hypothetical protein